MIDFLIIGQGLAGTTLAYQLLKQGAQVKIIQNSNGPSSSKVAGGMFNPVVGKNLAKSWLADELFPFLYDYYREIERLTSETFLHEIPIYRPFKNQQQKQQFCKAIEKHGLQQYCKVLESPTKYTAVIKEELGGILTQSTGRLDVKKYLSSAYQYFSEKEILLEREFIFDDLIQSESGISFQGISAKTIIFCEGAMVKNNPFFNRLPFNPVKGETLEIKIDSEQIDWILNQGKWIMPLGNGVYRAGSTYVWHELNNEKTVLGRQQIEEGLATFLKVPFQTMKQEAGIRPSTAGRRPFIGAHPHLKNVYIFNGLGTKGVSLAPYFAQNLADHLISGKEIHSETTITRHYALY